MRDSVGSQAQPLTGTIAAGSLGIVGGVLLLDLAYEEDVKAETDMNVVRTGDGRFVEVQGTAEGQHQTRRPARLLNPVALSRRLATAQR